MRYILKYQPRNITGPHGFSRKKEGFLTEALLELQILPIRCR